MTTTAGCFVTIPWPVLTAILLVVAVDIVSHPGRMAANGSTTAEPTAPRPTSATSTDGAGICGRARASSGLPGRHRGAVAWPGSGAGVPMHSV